MSFNLKTLTEGIKQRNVGSQNKRLVEKWSRTGLLRGLEDTHRENMATLLENQASQLLREANTLGGAQGTSSDIRGFTNIAFPIVRRVFGGLVANELVSIQPMSLPSGLLFYLDYTYGSDVGGDADGSSPTYKAGESIYHQPTGKQVRNGSFATGGQFDLTGSGFTKVHEKVTLTALAAGSKVVSVGQLDVTDADHLKLVQFDQQVIDAAETSTFHLLAVKLAELVDVDDTQLKDVSVAKSLADDAGQLTRQIEDPTEPLRMQGGLSHNVRRLNQRVKLVGSAWTSAPTDGTHVLVVVRLANGKSIATVGAVVGGANNLDSVQLSFVKGAQLDVESDGSALTVPTFESDFGVGAGGVGAPEPVIPEIDIKIESVPVTAQTRKLRARWSPELAQDLNAYHSMDAEVELTQILSEQIALEIDREILNDLLTQAQGANFFWSRAPGKFVNKRTGAAVERTSTLQPGPAFTGTVREWYETLSETIIDVANEIHRKTLRGSANFIVISPDVATILEASVLYRPSYSIDGDGQVASPFTMGAEKIGTLSNRFTVYKDPYFPRNKILVGYKGGSYLETGFVYAPYVPLIVTPTIFQPEDFTPRKGVMTRYGKKMVRADFYGTVTCLDMNII